MAAGVPDTVVVDGGKQLPGDEIGPDVVEDTDTVGVGELANVLQAPGSDVIVVTVTRTGRTLVTAQQLPDVIFP